VKKPIPFGKYYLLERVNVGGMAEVFKAKAFGVEGFERLLAVKRILPNIAEDKEFIEMFIDEAKISVQLNHANIAQIFDLGKVEDSFFIALEFVHGKDLRSIFDRGRQMTQIMPIAQACFVIMKVCEGLDYAHNKRDAQGRELNLVHRDVSPQNVLVSYEGEIKLIDFGIAKAAGKASKTQAGILKGKFGYMSPEQVRGLPIDRRSDIFSVGIVLYELLTGERLFVGESDFSTLEKVRNVEILPPSTYNRKIPDELERIVLKTLAKDVEDRYQNAIDLHDDLQAFMYTAGEFYSRKDLAAWMKKTFATEIEEETRKLEEYRNISPPDPRTATPSKPMSQPGRPSSRPATNPPPPPPAAMASRQPTPKPTLMGLGAHGQMEMGAAVPAGGGVQPVPPAGEGLEWDDEELETQIYDKPDGEAGGANGTGEVAIEDASKPTPLIDNAAVPPIAFAPTQAPMPTPMHTPMHTPQPTQPPSGPIRLPGIDGTPGFTETPSSRSLRMPVVEQPAAAFGARLETRKSVFLPVAILAGVLLLCIGAVVGFWTWSHRPGSIAVTSFPSDAQVLIDQVMVAKETPYTIDKSPGSYQVTVQREGYESRHEVLEVKPGKRVELRAELVPLSADLGFVLDSEPPGQRAFLDGQQLSGVTPLKVSRITAGKHNVEVRGAACYTPWTQEFNAEAGKQPTKLHAQLKATSITAQIKSEPAGAKAFVIEGGKRTFAGATPASVKLDPAKKYAVALQHTGYKETTQDIRFDGSCELVVDVSLDKVTSGAPPVAEAPPQQPKIETPKAPKEPRPPREKVAKAPKENPEVPDVAPPPREKPKAAAASGSGFLKVGSRPWTKVTIDGEEKGNTPQEKIQLPAGKHKLVLSNPQFNINHTQTIEIAPNETTTVIKKFEVAEKPE
jgi:serine/threonine protein kinase